MASPRKTPQSAGGDDGSSAEAPARSTSGRACGVCGIKLSAYNTGPHCWRHSSGVPWRGPSAKPKFH